jgi:HlyD family secretion protein
MAVPIQAMTLREVIVDEEGHIVRPPMPKPGERRPPAGPPEVKEGQTRKELEGVFMLQENRALFIPVKTGIAGEKYFEVLEGLKEGDQVITGPFQSVRGMKDGDEVKSEASPTARGASERPR